MKNIILPDIVAVGAYNAQLAVKNREITKNRKTTMFELELATEEGGISYINSESFAIKPDLLICAKPGQIRHTRLPFKCFYIHITLGEGALYDILMNAPNYIMLENNLSQMEQYVVPELKEKSYEIMCDFWGKNFVDKVEKLRHEK